MACGGMRQLRKTPLHLRHQRGGAPPELNPENDTAARGEGAEFMHPSLDVRSRSPSGTRQDGLGKQHETASFMMRHGEREAGTYVDRPPTPTPPIHLTADRIKASPGPSNNSVLTD